MAYKFKQKSRKKKHRRKENNNNKNSNKNNTNNNNKTTTNLSSGRRRWELCTQQSVKYSMSTICHYSIITRTLLQSLCCLYKEMIESIVCLKLAFQKKNCTPHVEDINFFEVDIHWISSRFYHDPPVIFHFLNWLPPPPPWKSKIWRKLSPKNNKGILQRLGAAGHL